MNPVVTVAAAQRLAVPKPVSATYGGFAVRILEIGLTGCQIEHAERIPPKSRFALRFKWRGAPAGVDAAVIRSEMRSAGGKPVYVSSLEFCKSPDDAPAVVRQIVTWLAKATSPGQLAAPEPEKSAPAPAEPVPAAAASANPEDEIEAISADYLQCTFTGGEWMRMYVSDPKQPPDGFTIPAPSNDAEADVLCRAYERADPKKRQAMRASFEAAMKQKRR